MVRGEIKKRGNEMKVIGLTGGTGSGKSVVSKSLAAAGAVVIDADKIAPRSPKIQKNNFLLWLYYNLNFIYFL